MRQVKLIWLWLALAGGAWGASGLTTVAQTIHNPDGTLFYGTIEIRLNAVCLSAGGALVYPETKNVSVAKGVFTADLYPNSTCTPATTSYNVRYVSRGNVVKAEVWVLTASSPTTIDAVRTSTPPTPTSTIALTQIAQGGATTGQVLTWSGGWTPTTLAYAGDIIAVGDCTTGSCFQSVAAGRFFGGPVSGPAAIASARALDILDIPSLSTLYEPIDTTIVRNGQNNTFSTGNQSFASATSLTVPTSAGAAPTVSGRVAYDSTANLFKAGVNGSGKTFAFLDSNITGTAANVSSTVALANGGTNQTSWTPSRCVQSNSAGTALESAAAACGSGGGGGASASSDLTDLKVTVTSGTRLDVAACVFGPNTESFTIADSYFTIQSRSVSNIGESSVTTFTTSAPLGVGFHNGDSVNVAGVTGTSCSTLNNLHVITVTGASTFTVAINTTGLTCTGGTVAGTGAGSAFIYARDDGEIVAEIPASSGVIGTCDSGPCSVNQVTTPSYDLGIQPLATVTLAAGAWATATDARTFLGKSVYTAGTGITVTGNAIAIDTALVPQLGGTNAWTGSNDFRDASVTAPHKTGTTAPATCTVGESFWDSDASPGSNTFGCTATNTWTLQGGGEGGGAPTDAQYVTLATNSSLSAERVLTAGAGITLTDAGANGAATITFNPLDSTTAYCNDHFVSTLTSNTGRCGWASGTQTSGGTGANIDGEAGHPGIVELTTGASDNDHRHLTLSVAGGVDHMIGLNTATNWEVNFLVRIPTATSVAGSCGIGDYGFFASNVIAIKFDTDASDTTWRYYNNNNTTPANQDSTVSVSAGTWYKLRIWSVVSGTVWFSVNDGNALSTTTPLPSVSMSPYCDVRTRTTATRTLDIDRASWMMSGL